jgi:heme-degrading monooxygenase HmoA
MIVRIWRGWTLPEKAAAYARHAAETVFPQLRRINGFRSGVLLQRRERDVVEFVVETTWDSLDAIREFAGEHIDRAVVEPRAREVLLRFDEFVRHYELLHNTGESDR